MNSYIDITDKFFDKLDNIISLKKIEEILIDISSFNDFQISDVFKYLSKKMTSLKNLKISGCNFSQNNLFDLNAFLTNPNERIDKIDFSNCLCPSTITSVLYSKKFPLTSLKIKMVIASKDINWIFLDNNKDNLEELEIDINNDYEDKYKKEKNDLVLSLNKMAKLKKLKIKGGFDVKDLKDFYNYSNIEYFDVELKFEYFIKSDSIIYAPFSYFQKLKSLIIGNNFSTNYFFEFKFPPSLNCLNFKSINGKCIISLLKENIDNLAALEEFKLEKCLFDDKDLEDLLNLMDNFNQIKNKYNIIYYIINNNLRKF